MTDIQWHPVRRIVHLDGGIRAINNPGSKVTIDPWTTDNKIVQFDLPNYQSLLIVLNSLKINVFGIDYYSNPDQLSGIYPPEWYSYGRMITTNNPLQDSVRS
ncbi:MAG: hypothetical protein AAFY50_24130 [Cyanobacteria bacterium J06648_1]